MDNFGQLQESDLMQMADAVDRAFERIESWRKRRSDAVFNTPLLRSRLWLEKQTAGDAPVFIKLESEQVTGSFKVRGTFNRILCALESSPNGQAPCVITASTGNHALAIAHTLEMMGHERTSGTGCIFLPSSASESKVRALRSYKDVVELTFVPGDDCIDAERAARDFAQKTTNAMYVSPYNDYDLIAGQGTIAVEILRALKNGSWGLDPYAEHGTLYVTVGGGGLISGVGSYFKSRAPGWRIVGAQPLNSAVMCESVKQGRIVHIDSEPTLSDGSAGGLEEGCLPFSFCSALVDDWILVNENEIAAAIRGMASFHKKIVEGTAAVSVAAFLKDTLWRKAHPYAPGVIIACGSNINFDAFTSIVARTSPVSN